jgi:hypothetical protein
MSLRNVTPVLVPLLLRYLQLMLGAAQVYVSPKGVKISPAHLKAALPARAIAAQYEPSTRVLALMFVDDEGSDQAAKLGFLCFDVEFMKLQKQSELLVETQVLMNETGALQSPMPCVLLPAVAGNNTSAPKVRRPNAARAQLEHSMRHRGACHAPLVTPCTTVKLVMRHLSTRAPPWSMSCVSSHPVHHRETCHASVRTPCAAVSKALVCTARTHPVARHSGHSQHHQPQLGARMPPDGDGGQALAGDPQ